MAKGSIQPGVERGKIQVCPACGSKFIHVDPEEAASRLICPNHPQDISDPISGHVRQYLPSS